MAYNPINPNGQATSANSSPVVIASDQSAVTVGGTITPFPSAAQAGLSVNRQITLSNTAVAVKNSAGNLYGYNIFNPGVALTYFNVYNVAAASVTVGTTVPVISVALPSNANSSIGDDTMYTVPISFSAAISISATTTPNGNTAPLVPLVTNTYFI